MYIHIYIIYLKALLNKMNRLSPNKLRKIYPEFVGLLRAPLFYSLAITKAGQSSLIIWQIKVSL